MGSILRHGVTNLMIAGVLALAACGDGATSPGIQPEIVNATDNFQYQVSAIEDYSGTQTYTWQNTGTTATINQSASVSAGSATLVLLDADGTQVYSRSLAEDGTFASAAGAAGNWTVRVSYSSVNATVNFRADKAN
jgi:hypothetical protein